MPGEPIPSPAFPQVLPPQMTALYLERLGLESSLLRQSQSIEALTQLNNAHVRRIAYETLSLQKHRLYRARPDFAPVSLSPEWSVHNIISIGRGGICWQLNTAFASLLQTLGYQVALHPGWVHEDGQAATNELPRHIFLSVDALHTPDNPSGKWIVDVGLGSSPTKPLPLTEHSQTIANRDYTLARSDSPAVPWELTLKTPSVTTTFAIALRPIEKRELAGSHKRRTLQDLWGNSDAVTIINRDEHGTNFLSGAMFRSSTESKWTMLRSEQDWYDTIHNVFNIDTSDFSELERQALWQLHDPLQLPAAQRLAQLETPGFAL